MEQQQKPGIVRRGAGAIGKGWAYSLGLTGLYRDGQRIAGSLGAAAGKAAAALRSSPARYRRETFEEAVQRMGLSEQDLLKQARVFNTRVNSWILSMCLAVGWLLAITISDSPWSHALVCFGLIFLSAGKALCWRFRWCQIRDLELYSFGPWACDPRRW